MKKNKKKTSFNHKNAEWFLNFFFKYNSSICIFLHLYDSDFKIFFFTKMFWACPVQNMNIKGFNPLMPEFIEKKIM